MKAEKNELINKRDCKNKGKRWCSKIRKGLTNEELDICFKKYNKVDGYKDKSWQELAEEFGFSNGEALRCTFKRYRKLNGLLGGDKTKILCISDLHIPFQLDQTLDILKPYKNKVDILLFNGDEQDCQSISKFRKKYRIPFVDELVQTRQLIIDIIKLIKPKKVYFNYGNHNIRLINYMSDQLNEDLLEIMPETNLELIIENGFFKKDRMNGTKVFYEPLKDIFNNINIIYTHSWFNQIGSVIFCHPTAYRKGVLKTAEDAWLYFKQHDYKFDTLVCSHTHMAGIYGYGNGFIIENGCLCKPQEYATSGKFLRPQINGMFYCVLEDGVFNYNDSKLEIFNKL